MASIRYEAETQRQHPRYQLPMRALVNDVPYAVLDWSLGGFAISAVESFAKGEIVETNLTVPFNGYDLGINVRAEVRYASSDRQRVGFAFIDLDERQASLLRYVADAIVSGEIVQAGDVLEVAGRSGSGRPRNMPAGPPPGFMARMANGGRRLVATTAVVAIIGALGAYLWANVYDELYVVRAQTASVAAKVVNLASPAVGRIGYVNVNKKVALGEPLLTVNPPVGNPIVVQSPCDCLQIDKRFSDGDFVKTGETVLQLMREGSPIVISALVPSEQLMSLYNVKNAQIVYADGSKVEDASILWLPGQGDTDGNLPREPLTVVLDPQRQLSSSMVGQPVEVTFDLFTDSSLGRIVHSVIAPGQVAAEEPAGKEARAARENVDRP